MPETHMIKRGISSAYKKPARVSMDLSKDLFAKDFSGDHNSDPFWNGKPVGVSGSRAGAEGSGHTSFKKYLAVYVDGFSENLVEQGPFVAVTSDRASRPYSGISDCGVGQKTGQNTSH
ncbi:hypothetical protein [Kiloniella majae]|uniref:hypothetical protein n=1 Tax=Kiloniella majae TaxID=1938558 RepID=UPI000A278004|nr:hypothetical protein [Kiloniella majae]